MTLQARLESYADSLARWQAQPGRVITPMGLALALSLLGDATLYTVLPTHTADAGIALGSVGVILGVNRAVRLLLNTPAGLFYDRWPRRRLFLPAAAIGVISTVIYALSSSFWPLLAGRLLWGLAWSGIWVGANTITLDIAGHDNRGRLMGWAQAWFFLGGALSFLVGGYLTDLLSYRQALWIGAGLSAVGLLVAAAFLPETRPAVSSLSTSHRSEPRPVDGRRLRQRLAAIRASLATLKGLGWLALYTYGVMRFCMAGVVAATLSLYVTQQLGARVSFGVVMLGAATMTGMLLGARPLLSLVTAPWAGTLSDRHGRLTMLRWGAWIGAVSFLLLAEGSPLAIVVSGILGALSLGMLSPVASALVGDVSSQSARGRNLGWLATAGDLGSAAGPVIVYALLSLLGLSLIYMLSAGLMISIWFMSLPVVVRASAQELASEQSQ